MAKRSKSTTKPAVLSESGARVRVVRLEEPAEARLEDDGGLSLEDLSQAYAAILNRGGVPYDEPEIETSTETEHSLDHELPEEEPLPAPASDAACDLSPQSILEAMLFVGHPQNEPLTARQVAGLMRGVVADEIDELIRVLNEQYALERCPYRIASEGSGYRLVLREEFSALREQFYGRVKEAKLSQAVIDTLAIVAYHQPIGPKEVDQLRGKPSGGILSQLVRRQLLRIERDLKNPRETTYHSTSRFLDLFGLDSLDDLPRSHEVE